LFFPALELGCGSQEIFHNIGPAVSKAGMDNARVPEHTKTGHVQRCQTFLLFFPWCNPALRLFAGRTLQPSGNI
jgi:hypothetical protein